MVASNQPVEFRTKRRESGPTFFSGEIIKYSDQRYKCMKHSPKVSPLETEEESKTDALNASFMIKEEGRQWNISHGKPPMEKQAVATCKQKRPTIVRIKLNTETKFQIPKGPETPEKKVNDHGVGFDRQGVALVTRMKKTLEKSGDESESEWVVLDLLEKLESMELSFNTLEATRIGITVNALKKHGSEQVRKMAVTLVKSWKDMVLEIIKKPSSIVEQTPKQVKQTNANMNSEKKLEGSEKAAKTPEKKVDDHGAMVYDQEVAEVLRMKKILEDIGDETESELVVCEMLTKLRCMGLSYKTLEATVIGKPVSALKKHPLEKVRMIARTLLKSWSRTADEWIEKLPNDVKPTSQQMEPTNRNMNTDNGSAGSEYGAKINGNGGVNDSLEKLEAAKRKLREGYEKVENTKKKRRIQVMELHEVTKQGLLPKVKSRINHNRRMDH